MYVGICMNTPQFWCFTSESLFLVLPCASSKFDCTKTLVMPVLFRSHDSDDVLSVYSSVGLSFSLYEKYSLTSFIFHLIANESRMNRDTSLSWSCSRLCPYKNAFVFYHLLFSAWLLASNTGRMNKAIFLRDWGLSNNHWMRIVHFDVKNAICNDTCDFIYWHEVHPEIWVRVITSRSNPNKSVTSQEHFQQQDS